MVRLNRLIFTLALLSTTNIGIAQYVQWRDTSRIPNSFWLGGAVGGSSFANASTVYLNIETGLHQRLLSFVVTSDATGYNTDIHTDLNTYGVLLGRVFKRPHTLYSASAGLGVVQLIDYPSQYTQTSVNVPILLQQYWVIAQTFGVGFGAFANLNTIKSTVGFNINFALGDIKTRRPKIEFPKDSDRKHWL